ncbi:MAG TPA: 2-succinyl-5-enolpyruvyl-6-hydroxy-3-cyclohexene-1-carboxylic-acid synthase [Thermoanaerobaculaceae bacterium]|nr:2-succinyl-5-enolpyruvyl-6-hydroxy-3-cyclohexene-1-carboxylic-acid synthase [Thermoanaerobaculaceae bacterium]
MIAANLHLRWAELLIDGLVSAGVRELVASPGSRSAPLVLAAGARADLRVTVLVDERVAAFFALGQAKATGQPTALVCTSGTAGAHYLPAVLEADEAGVPLVVVTADRPPEAHHRKAAQTTEQRGYFAGHVRLHTDLGTPHPDERALRGVRVTAALAAARAVGPDPGPVHLNAPFRKPLEPVPENAADPELAAVARRIAAEPLPAVGRPVADPDPEAVLALAEQLRHEPRGVLLAGPGPLGRSAAAAARLAHRLGYPLLAETASQLRWAQPGAAPVPLDLLAPDALAPRPGEPRVILQLGLPVVSAAWQRFLESGPACRRWVLGGSGWPDPWGGAAGFVGGDPDRVVGALLDALGGAGPSDDAWASAWAKAASDVAGVLAGWRDAERKRSELSELGAAWAAIEALPPGSLLVLGNSLAVREVDLVPASPPTGVGVLHQRGVAGIDGLIAGAAGAAHASSRPTLALVGDLAAVHDLGGLAAARQVASPLVIVVLANRGGRIFELLPLAAGGVAEAVVERLFLTPVEVDLASAAAAFGVRHHRAAHADELAAALTSAFGSPGPTVVEAVISGPGARARWTALRERARAVRA